MTAIRDYRLLELSPGTEHLWQDPRREERVRQLEAYYGRLIPDRQRKHYKNFGGTRKATRVIMYGKIYPSMTAAASAENVSMTYVRRHGKRLA